MRINDIAQVLVFVVFTEILFLLVLLLLLILPLGCCSLAKGMMAGWFVTNALSD